MTSFQEHAFDGGFANFEAPEEYSVLGRYAGLNSSQSSFSQLSIPVSLRHQSPFDTTAPVVSVSSTFYPGARNEISDTIFSSSDTVLFYLHSRLLSTAFRDLLSAPLSHPKYREEVVHIPATSTILTIILHVLYSTSPADYVPSFETLVTVFTQMHRHGIVPKEHITPASPMHDILLSFAARHPFDLYTLAAQFDLQDLAVSTSTYILSYSLSNISDAMAERMGPLYFKRLVFLHLSRLKELKSALLLPPSSHSPSQECGLDEQKGLTTAWVSVAGCMVWDARPALTTHSMQAMFNAIADKLACDLCKQDLRARLKDAVVRWDSVQCTI